MRRGEVWLVSLDPTKGSEIRKTRPCLVVSPDELNRSLSTIIVAPLTSGSRPAGFRIPVRFQRKDGLVLPDQIRTVSRERFVKKLGKLDAGSATAALQVLRAMFED